MSVYFVCVCVCVCEETWITLHTWIPSVYILHAHIYKHIHTPIHTHLVILLWSLWLLTSFSYLISMKRWWIKFSSIAFLFSFRCTDFTASYQPLFFSTGTFIRPSEIECDSYSLLVEERRAIVFLRHQMTLINVNALGFLTPTTLACKNQRFYNECNANLFSLFDDMMLYLYYFSFFPLNILFI